MSLIQAGQKADFDVSQAEKPKKDLSFSTSSNLPWDSPSDQPTLLLWWTN